MATDISKVGNVVEVTVDDGQPKAFAGSGGIYWFNAAGTILSISFGGVNTYDIPLSDLTIGGAEPADVDAAYTALSTVFPSEGGGSGSTPTLSEVLTEGNDAEGKIITNVDELSSNSVISQNVFASGSVTITADGTLKMVDTETDAQVIITVANGAFVLTPA